MSSHEHREANTPSETSLSAAEPATRPSGKFTPGPWRAEWIRPDKAKGHTFDPTCSTLGESPGYGVVRLADIPDPLDEEAEANARLIATAPALAALARRVAAHFAGTDAPLGLAAAALLAEIDD